MKIALVLQGGGSRGIFTSGILDCLLDEGISFDKVFAVSAGGLNAMNFISKQKERSRIATKMTFKSRSFKSITNVVTKHTFVDFDYYFNKLEKKLPFDKFTYETNPTTYCVVATSLSTGKAHYFIKGETPDFNRCIKASASIPFVAKPVPIYDDLFLDGGDSDPVPFKKALEEGFDKIVVVTTRPVGFRKTPNQNRNYKRLVKLAFSNYPNYEKALINSHKNYNKIFDELEKPNDKIMVISPSEQINLKHLETDDDKLDYYYNLGIKDFNSIKEKLAKFIS